ncbi:alpha/beta fold hydrolase [Stenotrophobium rhamnosiphilum]|uniref:Alpha/beta hydrolase n=1 Tax=Stenotrophobium rhamnosiphilum TaxID=2029166 RepID=A0A2T5MIU1_9GAMM|nr:alpha/beta hydrolase [Stenotrophobium rhamnosiphilum]PTU32492.1 alpha/beta hydrolase [Stenotrophobium rhamnosiphilum]
MNVNTVSTQEIWIDTPRGRLYAKHWEPAEIDGRNLAPIVLFHDSLGSVELWRDFPERLAASINRTVIAYDRLGFGKSDAYHGKLALTFITDEAEVGFKAVREQLGFDTFIAVGHSVGGCMSVGVAARYPACLGVITESAQCFIEDRTRAGILEARDNFAKPGQVDRLKRYHGDKAQWVLDAWIKTWLSPEFSDWNLYAELERVRCPLLALHGENDEYGSLVQPQRMAERASGSSSHEIFPGCAHLPHRENPEIVLASISKWISTI